MSLPRDVETLSFKPSGWVPNNPVLPAVIMRGALEAGAGEAEVHALYRRNGWGGAWTWSVYDFHHYHSNAHEVLGCIAGRGRLLLGGPDGTKVEVAQGDVAVLPAGTGHRLLEGTDGFQVCGAYPRGQEDRNLLEATEANLRGAADRIARVALPRADPVFGADGPLMRAWTVE